MKVGLAVGEIVGTYLKPWETVNTKKASANLAHTGKKMLKQNEAT